jgi:outer membrane protein OmpA-like peptidoglycan-associated protein
LEDLFVRAEPFRRELNAEERTAAERLAFELRVALSNDDARLLQQAQRALELLTGERARGLRPFSLTRLGRAQAADLVARVEEALQSGRLIVERRVAAPLSDSRERFELALPPLPPAPRERGTHSFELRLLDEIGLGISGVEVDFAADEARTARSNGAGAALIEGVVTANVVARVEDTESIDKALEPRWQKRRPGNPPKEANLQELVYRGGPIGPLGLRAELSNTVVLKPPPGKLFAELFDKSGRVRHAQREYSIRGPESFSGKTDDDGRLLHEPVFPGDYELSLKLEHFKGDPDESSQTVTTQLVVLEPTSSQPQLRRLGAAPRSVLARLKMFFNTNKTFLLPTALPSVRKLRRLYLESSPCKLLVVGHADTRGGAAFNDELSFERAEAIIAYLKDDVEAWFEQYDQGAEAKRRWGKTEDRLMIIAMSDFVTKPKGEDPVRWYQRTRGLAVDGDAGKETRRALIREYMSLDGASLADLAGEIDAQPHGCGENFPLEDDGEEVDEAPADEKRDHIDRRVELYFFDTEFGITPPPPGKSSKAGSPEYPKWRERVVETVELSPDDANGPKVTFIELDDALFRTNSAVVLPEGEAPSTTEQKHQSLTSISGFAMILRLNEERPGKKLFVAGHTDSTAGDEFNQKLSQERADCALAVLVGDREKFKALCQARHRVSDYKQILSWISRTFADFPCDPGKIDDNLGTADGPVRRFQTAYNENRELLGITQSPIGVDGSVGKQTWGAFFDLYELALAEELGEKPEAVAELRKLLVFADDERKALGFGEHFPIEELGVDHFRSQTNRRVELLMFDPGEEPDLVQAEDDPETSDLYLPGFYQRGPLPLRPGGAKPHMTLAVLLFRPGGARSGVVYELSNEEGFLQKLSDAAPSAELADTLELQFADVPMTSPLTLKQIVEGGTIDLLVGVPPAATVGDTPKRVFVTELERKAEPSERFFDYDVQEALS